MQNALFLTSLRNESLKVSLKCFHFSPNNYSTSSLHPRSLLQVLSTTQVKGLHEKPFKTEPNPMEAPTARKIILKFKKDDN